jgi:alpha-galactosidase
LNAGAEWVAHFHNRGEKDTPVISDIQPLDATFPAQPTQRCWINHSKGSLAQQDDFEPLQTPLRVRANFRLAPVAGRSSNGTLPFFNLELGSDGVIGAIGWTGGWAAQFHRDAEGAVRVRAGMEETHLTLHPGEEVRTPRILLLFWEKDRTHAHNLFRRLVFAHYTPRPNGELIEAPISAGAWGDRAEQDQIRRARWFKEKEIPIDHWWIDAGWYGNSHVENSDTFGTEWYTSVGDWEPNKVILPNGWKPVGDALKQSGLGFVLWFEPERVFAGTRLTREHPQWLLGPVAGWRGDNYLLNLGIPEARQYITDLISDQIGAASVTFYRQDFNMDPAPFWKAADAPDRIGMSEIRHIEGLYAMWDDLLGRHPGLKIDNCSSGGRRIDLEMISRSIPLLRSDYQVSLDFDPRFMQTQNQGLSIWVPLSVGTVRGTDQYNFRSALGPGTTVDWPDIVFEYKQELDVDASRNLLAELKAMRKYFYGDFYPLLSFSLADDVWAAWQYDRPDLGEGIVLAFRRKSSPFQQMVATLAGLEPAASYEVQSIDDNQRFEATGGDLAASGFGITIDAKPGAKLFLYRRLN